MMGMWLMLTLSLILSFLMHVHGLGCPCLSQDQVDDGFEASLRRGCEPGMDRLASAQAKRQLRLWQPADSHKALGLSWVFFAVHGSDVS